MNQLSKMKYGVVHFGDEVCNEVPESWIVEEDGKFRCWFPKDSIKTTYYIKNPTAVEPNENDFTINDVNYDGVLYGIYNFLNNYTFNFFIY